MPLSARSLLSLSALTLLGACSGESSDGPGECIAGSKCDGVATCSPETQGLALDPVFGDLRFERPVDMVQKPGDSSHWYVLEQRGTISRIAANESSTPSVERVLDLRARTFAFDDNAGNEAGLFSMAFHPDFEQNGEVFLAYTGRTSSSPVDLQSRVSRFISRDGGQTIDRDSEEILIEISQPFTNHNGGQLAFGPDGFLYIGFGDGGAAGDPFSNGQNTDVTSGCDDGEGPCALLAKVLRIDVDSGSPYGIPSDNPFAGNPRCTSDTGLDCPEIYAIGIRNPWRFSFDPVTGELWLADVGQDAFEEIDIIEKGKNYGWRFREGNECFNPASGCPSSGLTPPVAAYGRNVGISVTGGFVYRGNELPSMAGQYVFADIGSGRLFATLPKADGSFESRIAASTSVQISAFGRGADGELYALDFARGGIHKVVAGECTDGSTPPELPEHVFLSRDGVGTENEANAYYASIIPGFTPGTLTLDQWIDEHMTGSEIVSAFYRNTADLGFWREMSCTRSIDRGVGGCWVRNWTSHDDAQNGVADLGTVAMDVSPEGFVRFYAFAPGGVLSPKAILDSEGEKFLPRLCTPCHNGQYLGAASNGDLGSIFREFEPSLFEAPPGADRDELEQALFELNQAARSANRALRREALGGPVGIDHAVDAVNDYIDEIYVQENPPVARDVGDPHHIPASWQEGSSTSLVDAQEELWTAVVNPTCMGCHRTNTIDFAELANFLQVGPTDDGSSLLENYVDTDPTQGKPPLALMPQAELLWQNLIADDDALDAIEGWLEELE